MGGAPSEAAAVLRAYAGAHGLSYYEHWSLPEATQLLHHGFMREVPGIAMGGLPGGLGNGWLAHVDFAFTGRADIERHEFTIAQVGVDPSGGAAVRVLCHDRELPEFDRSNPDVERETVELKDRAMTVESDAFLRRYVLSVDHDQDEVRAWELFDPDLIDWLTRQAPPRFSFELQDGALCCFVPGFVADAGGLDALCAGAARVHQRVLELGEAPAVPARAVGEQEGTREEILDRELGEHPFDAPPKSVKSAARKFGGLHIEDAAWQLGAEAFFRAHVAALGLKRVEPRLFRAAHMTATIPGQVTQAASGPIPHAGVDGWLLFTTDTDPGFQDVGFFALMAEPGPGALTFAFAGLPEFAAADKEHSMSTSADGSNIYLWQPSAPRDRTAKSLQEFLELAGPLLGRAVAAATGR